MKTIIPIVIIVAGIALIPSKPLIAYTLILINALVVFMNMKKNKHHKGCRGYNIRGYLYEETKPSSKKDNYSTRGYLFLEKENIGAMNVLCGRYLGNVHIVDKTGLIKIELFNLYKNFCCLHGDPADIIYVNDPIMSKNLSEVIAKNPGIVFEIKF